MCESANYIGYINCKPKDEFMNPEGFEIIDKALYDFTGLRLKSVTRIKFDGLSENLCTRPYDKELANDARWKCFGRFTVNRTIAFWSVMNYDGSNKSFENWALRFFYKYFDIDLANAGYSAELMWGNPRFEKPFKKLLKPHTCFSCCCGNS